MGGACVVLFVGMTACAEVYFFQTCDPDEGVHGILNSYRAGQGFPGTGEYEPLTLGIVPLVYVQFVENLHLIRWEPERHEANKPVEIAGTT